MNPMARIQPNESLRCVQYENGMLRKYSTPKENRNIHFSFMKTATLKRTASNTISALFLATLNLTLRNEKVGIREIINKEMIASWDQPTETVVFDTDVPSALQSMALQFSEKVRSFAPSLPRALACLR